MLKVGPNPYGLTCTLGLQGKSESPKDVGWFIQLAETMHGRCVEFHGAHLLGLDAHELDAIRERLDAAQIEPVISGPWPLNRIIESIPVAHRLGVKTVRTHLSPILCGARAEQGDRWPLMVDEIKTDLRKVGLSFSSEGLTLAVENHQDFGSSELLEFCEVGGPALGITLDTGNPLAVGEDPIEFATKVAPKVRHLHLKDYRAQTTPEGFRLVRCAIGEGCIPFPKIAEILASHSPVLTASLEPGALEARHIKLLTDAWWRGYPPRTEEEKLASMPWTRINAIDSDADYRTPWEKGEDMDKICGFEIDQMNKSVQYMQSLGWLPA